MNEFNFRVANAAPRASVFEFEIGQNGDTKTTYIYSYKTKYINGKSTGQKTNVDWDMESQNLPSGSTIKTSEVPSQLTITVPANNTSSTRSGKIVLLQLITLRFLRDI